MKMHYLVMNSAKTPPQVLPPSLAGGGGSGGASTVAGTLSIACSRTAELGGPALSELVLYSN